MFVSDFANLPKVTPHSHNMSRLGQLYDPLAELDFNMVTTTSRDNFFVQDHLWIIQCPSKPSAGQSQVRPPVTYGSSLHRWNHAITNCAWYQSSPFSGCMGLSKHWIYIPPNGCFIGTMVIKHHHFAPTCLF